VDGRTGAGEAENTLSLRGALDGPGIPRQGESMNLLFHPLVVHFPIGLWLASALFDILYVRTQDRFHFRAAQYLIGLGLMSAVVSIIAGFVDYYAVNPEEMGRAFIARHHIHQWLAYAATATYAVSFVTRWRSPGVGRAWIIALLIIGAALISLVGYIGGELRMVM
jgi:uncharacterized membrane protein